MDAYNEVATLLRALGHPVRLRILQLLRHNEACVCHLEVALGQRQPYLSQQLMRLREAKLVTDRREGLNVYYSLSDEAVATLLDAALFAVTTVATGGGRALEFTSYNFGKLEGCTCPACQPKPGNG